MSLYNYSVNKAVAAVNRAINFSTDEGALYEAIRENYRKERKYLPLKRALWGGFNGALDGSLIGAGIGAITGKKGSRGESALKGWKRGAAIGAVTGSLANALVASTMPKDLPS